MNDLIDWRTENCRFSEKELQGKTVTFDNIKYGILVEVKSVGGGYHSGMKVHFFNKKGVLVGNIYEFVPYHRIRFRHPYENGKSRDFQKFFMDKPFENTRRRLFIAVLSVVTHLIRLTQKIMD